MDIDGYGFSEADRGLQRLVDDFRTLSPAGIERAAWGWDRHIGKSGSPAYEQAERAAIHVIEQSNRGEVWNRARRLVFGMTEGDESLVSWRAEHGETGHKGERAAHGAVLALVAGEQLEQRTRETLLKPMAEALPWLLPGSPPLPGRG